MKTILTLPLLDAPAMGALLQRELPCYVPWDMRACRIHQTRRRISRKTEQHGAPHLGVVYALDLRHRGSGLTMTQWLYAKAYSRGASEAAFAEAQGRAQAAPAVGLPLTHLAALDLLLWAVPNDPLLLHLPRFLDTKTPCGPSHENGPWREPLLREARVEVPRIVRHEPESHCTVRFAWQARGGQRLACYGKTYVDESWQSVARRMSALRSANEADPRAFAIARPLGSIAALRAVWQQEVEGLPLRAALEGRQGELWMLRLAQALARLHAQPSMGDEWMSPQTLLQRARKQRDKLVRADESLAPVLDALLDRLLTEPPAGNARVPIHGDFHVDQMLCADGRVVLFDFDNFAEGSAANDVADIISQWLTDSAVPHGRAVALARCFVRSYLAHAEQTPSASELDWHLRLLLLRKAYSFFVRHRSGWPARVRHAVALASRGLDDVLQFTWEVTT